MVKDNVSFLVSRLSQEKRLRDRQTETEESLQKRLEAARIDMELSKFLRSSTWHEAEMMTTLAADAILFF